MQKDSSAILFDSFEIAFVSTGSFYWLKLTEREGERERERETERERERERVGNLEYQGKPPQLPAQEVRKYKPRARREPTTTGDRLRRQTC